MAKCCSKSVETDKDPTASAVFCPVSTTINLIGGKYKPLIIWNLFDGPKRYSQLHRAIPQATSKMLTQQLRELENNGLIKRTIFPVIPPHVEYSLTELGDSLKPVLRAIYRWGKNYLDQQGIDPNCGMVLDENSLPEPAVGSPTSPISVVSNKDLVGVSGATPTPEATAHAKHAVDLVPSVTLIEESTDNPSPALISIPTLLPPDSVASRKKSPGRRKSKAEPRPDEPGHTADLFG